ncbi:MAG: FHA domain-containing protein [Paludisphaera borealis]|uniref:FHA domain-containing protein n=1 Tax=Paludisphaera borealis TaxID=1387353 RepID=UPI002848B865|nr:FHA domain-containing protein [Paludisphaera borealis]MDR3622544.1 FHA domain-containing protein [Paludisphaera borealis]
MAHSEIALATGPEATEGETRPARPISLKAVKNDRVHDRRLEDWIAGNLDAQTERPETNLWNQLVGALPTARRTPSQAKSTDRGFKSRGTWNRFSVAYKRGITVVRLTDRALVKQAEIRELADDLDDLIGVGNQRVVLNFSKVERLGSWIVAAAVDAHRRCEAAEGGRLKVCGLTPQLAEIFEIIGMGRRIVLCGDEQAAIDGPWPASPGPRALPVDILEALVNASIVPPLQGGSPVEKTGAHASAPARASGAETMEGKVWLRVEYGGSKGRMIAVAGNSFVVGRDPGSHLRLVSPHVSKRHAAVEIRGARVFLRDLGSTNGTILNGEPLRAAEAELHSQDKILIGPVRCKIWIGLSRAEMEFVGALAPSTVHGDSPTSEAVAAPADPFPTENLTALGALNEASNSDEDAGVRIKCEVVQDVLVVTPIVTDLEGEEANEALRLKLHELSEQPLPRRVVVNLEFVGRLTRQTIGVLLAHHLRLDRVGGALRICEAHPRIMALLDQVRLTMLVDCYPCLDEAVLAAWTAHASTDASPADC